MSTADYWHYIPERLADALARWKARNPRERDQKLVHDFLMDCLLNPYECGKEDDDTGVFTGTAGRNIIIVTSQTRMAESRSSISTTRR